MPELDARERFDALVTSLARDPIVIRSTRIDNGVHQLEMRIIDDRTQLVYLGLQRIDGEDLVAFFSFIGTADPSLYERALRTNADLRYGRIALVEQGDVSRLAVVETSLLHETVDTEFLNALLEVGVVADTLEADFFGVDDE